MKSTGLLSVVVVIIVVLIVGFAFIQVRNNTQVSNSQNNVVIEGMNQPEYHDEDCENDKNMHKMMENSDTNSMLDQMRNMMRRFAQ